MSTRSVTGLACRSMLAASLAAAFLSGAVAEAADMHPEAQPISYGGSVGMVGEPGLDVWYVVPGAPLGHRGVGIDQIHAAAACTTAQPLEVSLYDPQGALIQKVAPERGVFFLLSPTLEGRYLLRLSVVDPSCAGLRYHIEAALLLGARASPNNNTAQNLICQGAKIRLGRWNQLLSNARRHHGSLARVRRHRAGAVASYNLECHQHVA